MSVQQGGDIREKLLLPDEVSLDLAQSFTGEG